MRKTTSVLVALLAAALTVSTAGAATADATPTVSAPTEGAVVATGFTGPVTAAFQGVGVGSTYTFGLRCEDADGTTVTHTQTLTSDGSATQSYTVPAITGPTACVLTVSDADSTQVLRRSFTVAGPALVLGDATLSATSFYPTVVDGFRDSVTASWTSNHTAGHGVRVLNSAGTVVRSADLGDLDGGTHTWTWNGRSTNGTRVPVGTYRLRFDADDHAGSTARFTRTVTVRSGYLTSRHSLSRAGNASASATSGSCYVTRSTSARTTSLDCWGGRYARASYGFRLPASAYAVRYALSGRRSGSDICCDGRISRAGSRVTRTAFRVTATVTGWRAYDVHRVAVSYTVRKRI